MEKEQKKQPGPANPAAIRKLPGRVLELCHEAGICKQDILYWAGCDETADYHFTEGYVILTREKLAVILYPPLPNQIYSLGGYRKEALRQQREAEVSIYEIRRLAGVKIQREIGRICLVLLQKDGDIRGAFSSNSLLSFWLPLEKLTEKLIKMCIRDRHKTAQQPDRPGPGNCRIHLLHYSCGDLLYRLAFAVRSPLHPVNSSRHDPVYNTDSGIHLYAAAVCSALILNRILLHRDQAEG